MTVTPMDDPTLAYYENQAQTFFDETVAIDMSSLYERFLAHVPPGGHILDVGCGSGRDALAFQQLGYRVTAFDPSPTLARLASAHRGLPVPVLRVQEVAWQDEFDAIWAWHAPTPVLTRSQTSPDDERRSWNGHHSSARAWGWPR